LLHSFVRLLSCSFLELAVWLDEFIDGTLETEEAINAAKTFQPQVPQESDPLGDSITSGKVPAVYCSIDLLQCMTMAPGSL
jgi:hypothetical protein